MAAAAAAQGQSPFNMQPPPVTPSGKKICANPLFSQSHPTPLIHTGTAPTYDFMQGPPPTDEYGGQQQIGQQSVGGGYYGSQQQQPDNTPSKEGRRERMHVIIQFTSLTYFVECIIL